jgi:tetratricopeptide (TPR) repeat protein
LPFSGSTPAEIADHILNREPDAIARYNYAVTSEIEGVLRKALEKRPAFRYQSARDLYIDVYNSRRRLTGDDSSSRGSRFRGSLQGVTATAVEEPTSERRVAIMNFANITADPADDWVGQGIAESLTADLTRVKTLSVVPREQIFELQRNLAELGRKVDERQAIELARRLGARVAISGAFQRLGPRIRITAQATEVAGARQLVTVKVDGLLDELFDLQDRLVSELTSGLKIEVAQQDRMAILEGGTESMEAYQAYARGMLNLRLANRDSIDRGIALLEQAIERDPRYVEAKVALAGALELKGSFLALPELFERSLALIDEALIARPDSADAYIQRGDTLLVMGRVDEAIAALRQGVRLQPDRASAHAVLARALWLGKGLIEEAIEAFEQTLKLNPSAGYSHLQLAMLYTLSGDFQRGEQQAQQAIELQDQAMSGTTGLIVVGAHSRLGYVYYRQGRYEDAIREYRRELELLSVGDHLLRERTSIELQQKLAAAYRRSGNVEAAASHERQALQLFTKRLAAGADEPFTRYYVAALHALRGEAEDANRHLERPLKELAAFTQWRLPRDPDFDSVRDRLTT